MFTKLIRFYNIVKIPINSLISLDIFNELSFGLKKKIFSIFKIKDIKEEYLYDKLLKLIIKNTSENNDKICSNVLNVFDNFLEHKILLINNNEDIKIKAFDYFINNSSQIMKENLYDKYILIFQIQEKLIQHFEIRENLLKFETNSIYLIKLLNFQDKLSFKDFDLINKEKNSVDFTLINDLFHTYNRTDEEPLNLK